ncbi:hypothetical protein LP7551_01628 [Roseibium album]|nr:hypothetical protein LP7551_01628 [Roseibium album]
MGARKFMLDHANEYYFEVISADQDFLDNRVGKHHPLKKVPFERLSMKSALSWLMTHPDVELSEAQFTEHRASLLSGGYGASHKLEQHSYQVPKSYEAAEKIKEDARWPRDLEKRKSRKSERMRASMKARRLFDLGTPVIITGATAVALLELISQEAKESGISYPEAAQALGLDFTEERLKGFASEAGIDLAITLTPIGPLKKAWDILGNADDIVAVTQLYGAAYPENETIQQLAGIADAVESSPAFGVYVEGRDALTGAVGSVIDGLFGSSPDEDQLARSLGNVRQALVTGGGAVEKAVMAGASQEEMADVLKSEVNEISASGEVLSNVPVAQSNLLSPETILAGDEKVPLSGAAQIPGSQPILPPAFETEQGHVNGSAASAVKSDPFQRKTSYERYQSFGFRPEEKAQALDEHKELLRKSYLDMNGHEEAAEMLAVERFLRKWGPSAFAPDADGIVMKYPVEKVYPGLENSGHGYVRDDVEEFLAGQGIKAGRWYLSPNEKTGQDWGLGWTDEEGYGPRMTLAYEDAAGRRHQVTDRFQANVRRASLRQSEKPAKGVQGREAQGGAARQDPAENTPQKLTVPVPRQKPEIRPVGH